MSQTTQLIPIYLAFHKGFEDKLNGLPYKNPYKKSRAKAYLNGYKATTKTT